MTVRIVTDSSAVLPPEWVRRYGIRILPIELAWPDGTISSGDEPYSAVAARLWTGSPPKTAAPSPWMYEELFAQYPDDELLVVCPSSDLSSTYQNAVVAARKVGDDRVRVLDARTAAAGQGIVAAEAARAAAAGRALDAVVLRAISVTRRVAVWATLSQLEFLRRSGRIPAVAAFGAGALRLQPVVRYAGSSPQLVSVVRSPAAGWRRVVRAWERSFVGATPLRFVAFHAARASEAEEACELVRRRVPDARAYAVEVPASLAAHTGPGLFGVAWFWDN